MTAFTYNDRGIGWKRLVDFAELLYSILNIDEQLKRIEVLFKFAANR